MLAQTIYNENVIWAGPFAQADGTITNPALVFKKVMDEVGAIYLNLETEYGVSIDEMDKFLASYDFDTVNKLNNLWDEVDCDIYDDFLNSTISVRHYIQWKNALEEWVKLFESTVRLFIYRQFDKVFEIPNKFALKAA
jgi:hypothetical protein